MKRKFADDQENVCAGQGTPCKMPTKEEGVGVISPPFTLPVHLAAADAELRRVMDNFVNVYEQLDTCDNVQTKPNYSYTELVYLAMLRSPNFCLPITEIYRYIECRFLFFKNSTRGHWKNAVRHSLSKTKCFTKIPVGRGTSSTGNLSRSTYLWCIVPSSLVSFARGDYRPTIDRESGTNTLRWGYYRINAGQFWDQVGTFISKKMEAFKMNLATGSDPALVFEAQVCSLPDSTEVEGNLVQSSMTSAAQFELSPSVLTRYDLTPASIGQYSTESSYLSSPEPCNDPWMSKTIVSPNTSDSSLESESISPPFTPINARHYATDSGNESLSDSSPDEQYYRSLPSCRMERHKYPAPSHLAMKRDDLDCSFDRDRYSSTNRAHERPTELSPLNNFLVSNVGEYVSSPTSSGHAQYYIALQSNGFSPEHFSYNFDSPVAYTLQEIPLTSLNIQPIFSSSETQSCGETESSSANTSASDLSDVGILDWNI